MFVPATVFEVGQRVEIPSDYLANSYLAARHIWQVLFNQYRAAECPLNIMHDMLVDLVYIKDTLVPRLCARESVAHYWNINRWSYYTWWTDYLDPSYDVNVCVSYHDSETPYFKIERVSVDS